MSERIPGNSGVKRPTLAQPRQRGTNHQRTWSTKMAKSTLAKRINEEVVIPESIQSELKDDWTRNLWRQRFPGRVALSSFLSNVDMALRGLRGIDRILRAHRQLELLKENEDHGDNIELLSPCLLEELDHAMSALIN